MNTEVRNQYSILKKDLNFVRKKINMTNFAMGIFHIEVESILIDEW